jgi:hypothetical protein
MNEHEPSLTIRSRAAAAVFAHPRARWILLNLVAGPQSASALARRLGVSPGLVHYHVCRFVKLGLVRIVRSERRPGRSIKFYQAAAVRFFVPAALIGQAHHHRLHQELRGLLDRASTRSRSAGIMFETDARGTPRMRSVDASESSNEYWKLLRLNKSQALSLAHEVSALLKRYEQNSNSSRETYLVHFAAAPRE